MAPHRAALASSGSGARPEAWAKRRDGLIAEAWEALCRGAAHRVAANLSSSVSSPWLPANRWWRGAAPEWDIVACTADRDLALVGEVKWSAAALDAASLEHLGRDVLNRPLPPGMPTHVIRAVFVPQVKGRLSNTRGDVRVVTADAVMNAG